MTDQSAILPALLSEEPGEDFGEAVHVRRCLATRRGIARGRWRAAHERAQEQFSLAFVQMVVAAAGCSIKRHDTDYDGVDITIVSSAEYEKFYCPEFESQLQCTSRHELLTETHLAWPMEAKPFRKLTHPKRYNEAYLGVLLLPDGPDPWLELSEAGLATRGRLYWERAANLGTLPEDRGSRTVHLPRSDLFGVEGLLGIMRTIGEGGGW